MKPSKQKNKIKIYIFIQIAQLPNLFKYVYFVLLFCVLLHRLAVRISLQFHIFLLAKVWPAMQDVDMDCFFLSLFECGKP